MGYESTKQTFAFHDNYMPDAKGYDIYTCYAATGKNVNYVTKRQKGITIFT